MDLLRPGGYLGRMNRTERLAAIVLRLQARSLVRARDLADEFEVGLRTIYRDMEALAESGVPLRAEAGVGYALERGWKLPPLSLTAAEAASLLVACRIAERGEGREAAAQARQALAKVRAALAAPERDYVERLEAGVEAFTGLEAPAPAAASALAVLRDAVAGGKLVRLTYTSSDGELSERVVEPLGLYRERSGWRLVAWCRLREGYRQFVASRIAEAVPEGGRFDRSLRPSAAELLEIVGEASPHFEARLVCLAGAASPLKEAAYAVRSERLEDGRAELEIVAGDADWFARATLGAASGLVSVSPPELAEAYARQARLALEAALACRRGAEDC
jgi:predicted DNA-binding transcriptional regulator YafY